MIPQRAILVNLNCEFGESGCANELQVDRVRHKRGMGSLPMILKLFGEY